MSNRITFYSVSPVGNNVDMKVAVNITISNGVATLSAAQTGNIGAGCRIEYASTHAYIAPNRIGFDSGGTTEIKIGDKIEGATSGATGIVRAVHIASGDWASGNVAGHIYFEKTTGTWQDNEQINRVKPTSASNVGTTNGTLEGNIGNGNTEFAVLTATGADASDQSSTSVTHIYHEYSSLALWEAGFTDSNHLGTTDLTTNGDTNYACCYYDHSDTSNHDAANVTVDYGTSDSNGYVYIFCPYGGSESINRQRPEYQWKDEKYILIGNVDRCLYVKEDYTTICNLQIELKRTNYTSTGIEVLNSANYTRIYNNFIKGVFSGTEKTDIYAGIYLNASGTTYVWNNVIMDYHMTGTFPGMGIYSKYGSDYYVYNNTVYNCYNGYHSRDGHIHAINNLAQSTYDDSYPSADTFKSDSDYNISDDTTDTGGSHDITSASVTFENASNDDFRLAATDTTAKDKGTDLSSDSHLPIWRDIVGNERGSSWDIGAFEYVATGGATATVSDTLTLSGTLTGLGKYRAAAIDSIGFGETVTPLARLLGTISDIVNLADTADVSSAIAGVIQDTLGLSDTLSALAGFKGSLADTISLAESLTVLAAWKIAISDNIALNDEAKTNLIASVIDSLRLSDTTAGLGNYKSDTTDIVNFGDTASGLRTLIAAAVDSLDFVTSVTGIVNDPGGLTATVLDTLGFSDSVAALGNYQVELVDGVDLNDATTALAGYIQSIIDTIGLSDTISVLEADGIVTATFTAKIPGATFTAKIPGITFTLI